ncbi:unnamed protein product [[Candida] boidinii]|uniref:Unnamed protein product n=1 Tax=Candida boidinii TaxID=5477 RepID=A0A9W6T3H3_CANBO|nr:unnamed protein product [[Candida] boidinii]
MAKKKAPTPKSDPREVKNSKDPKESSKSSKGSKNSKDTLPDPGQVKRANGRTTVAQSSSWTEKARRIHISTKIIMEESQNAGGDRS